MKSQMLSSTTCKNRQDGEFDERDAPPHIARCSTPPPLPGAGLAVSVHRLPTPESRGCDPISFWYDESTPQMDLWWGFLRLCRTRRQQASIFCICCRLPSRGPFKGTAPGRGKTDNRSQIFLLFSPAPPSTRGFRSAPAKERPRLETNITTQHQRGRASRVMSPGGMAVGNGMRVPEKFGSSRNASSARIFWAVLGCCRVSPLPTRTSRNPPRSPGTHTLSHGHGSSFRRANGILRSDCKWSSLPLKSI